jgi:hypothetical protein
VSANSVTTIDAAIAAKRTSQYRKAALAQRIAKRRGNPVNIDGNSLPGNRTNPDEHGKRDIKATKVRAKELQRVARDNTHTYLLQRAGIINPRDQYSTETALAVLVHYRLIIASRKAVN